VGALICLFNNRFTVLIIHACAYSLGSKFKKRPLLQPEQRQQRYLLVQQQERRLQLPLPLQQLLFVNELLLYSVKLLLLQYCSFA